MADTCIRNEDGKLIHVVVDLLKMEPLLEGEELHYIVAMKIDDFEFSASLKEAITLGRMLSELELPKLR